MARRLRPGWEVDRDAFTVYSELRAAMTGYTLRPDRELHQIPDPAGQKFDAVRDVGVKVEREGELFAAIAAALDVGSLLDALPASG